MAVFHFLHRDFGNGVIWEMHLCTGNVRSGVQTLSRKPEGGELKCSGSGFPETYALYKSLRPEPEFIRCGFFFFFCACSFGVTTFD